MSTSEISNENVMMASFDDMLEEVYKVFEECSQLERRRRCMNFLHAT
jgi:hypothetical protein